MKHTIHDKLLTILRSTRFFYATLILFVLEASWIALSGVYPMAYDENYHLGLIQLYAHRWLPFWTQQPAGADIYGAVARDPSYLYHYLLSFPYRLMAQFTGSQTTQVLALRFASIGLFVAGLYIFRRLLSYIGASRAAVHTVLILFVLTPIVPLVAAQINYDSLAFPVTGLLFLLSLQIVESIKKADRVPVAKFLTTVSLGLMACLVKYTFLPILVGLSIWIGVVLIKYIRRSGTKNAAKQIHSDFTKQTIVLRVVVIIALLLSIGLFFERYGINILRYDNPVPNCQKVLSVNECKAYSPWLRDYQSHLDKLNGLIKPVPTSPLRYTTYSWLKDMTNQLFYTLNGPASGFIIGQPLVLPRVLFISLGIIGVIGAAVFWRRYLVRNFKLSLLTFVSLLYIAVLWQRNYGAFLYNGYPVAIQVRYLVALLPLLYLVIVLAYSHLLRTHYNYKILLTSVALMVFLFQGGGAGVFILRSDPSWYWPNSAVTKVNRTAKKVLDPVAIGP